MGPAQGQPQLCPIPRTASRESFHLLPSLRVDDACTCCLVAFIDHLIPVFVEWSMTLQMVDMYVA